MAPRKDMMRIIRQDAGFSAKLGFGGADAAQASEPIRRSRERHDRPKEATTLAIIEGHEGSDRLAFRAPDVQAPVSRDPEKKDGVRRLEPHEAAQPRNTDARGQVVYVAVSLTAQQAIYAERWAQAARCTVSFLIRHVAQALRDPLRDDWERNGMPAISEARGTRGKFPTSITLTLPPQFAADLAARHDPLGIIGLGRAMGPAFRARFEEAFDEALIKAGIHFGNTGDET